MKLTSYTSLLILLSCAPFLAPAQETVVVDSTDPESRTVIAGWEYKAGSLKQFLWGKHYRKEWTTPVRVPVLHLDTVYGGLTATEQGGGRQTKTLRLKDRNGKEYVLRSINKDYRAALPEIVHGTFIERLAKDQVSTAHPFAAVTIPMMIEAAAIYHTRPKIVFIPYTPSLGEFNKTFANQLFLFEERPDDNQEKTPNFGFSKDVVGTEKMFEKTREENDHRVDQKAYVRARLFDMFLGDWGRHEDQWRWAKFDIDDQKIYRPIPRDRDQTYTKFDGFLLQRVMSLADIDHLQSFDHTIKDIKTYNFPARDLDRQLANGVSQETWVQQARELQEILTDQLIEKSVGQLPPEIFKISGPEIISKLRSRRNNLLLFAIHYYKFLAREVDILGSDQNEYFEVIREEGKRTTVNIYDLNKEGQPKKNPFYTRTFLPDETREIRLYGLKGNDRYHVKGSKEAEIQVRLIGGLDKDSVVNETSSGSKLKYYDNEGNIVTGRIKSEISSDTAINTFKYKAFKYDKSGFLILPSYSNVRGIHLNVGYKAVKQQWRKEPFGTYQRFRVNYSLSNHAFGGDYQGMFTELIGKWNLAVDARYDQEQENYFFGKGNETVFDENKLHYRLFTEEGYGQLGLNRILSRWHTISISGFFHYVDVLPEIDNFIARKVVPSDGLVYRSKNFAGLEAGYTYHNYNDEVVPTKGLNFAATARHTANLRESGRSVNHYEAILGIYLPITKALSIANRTGGSTLSGEPEFYQLISIGGGRTLRGYQRQRFTGNTSFYNDTDLRWIFNARSRIFNGKIGLIAFYDRGRVWYPGEKSTTWHFGYGGGLLIAPFNKASVTVYYGMSEENTGRIHLRLGKLF